MSLVVDTMAEIGVTRVSRWIFNCYVIHAGEGGPVIADAGLPRLADDLPPVLADLAIDPAAAVAIVATHGHSDHVGGALALSSRLGLPVYLPAVTLTYLEGVTPRTPGLAKVAPIWPTFLDQPFDPRAVAGGARGTKIAGYGTREEAGDFSGGLGGDPPAAPGGGPADQADRPGHERFPEHGPCGGALGWAAAV